MNSPHWEGGDHRSVEDVLKEVRWKVLLKSSHVRPYFSLLLTLLALLQTKKLKKWSEDHLKAKEINPKEDAPPDGYHYKGNITEGPLVKIKVDPNNALIDWDKAKVHVTDISIESSMSSDLVGRVMT